MNDSDAIALLRPAVVPAPDARWADLGAGTGIFTRALAALLGPGADLYAVDRDDHALQSIRAWADRTPGAPSIHILTADFTTRLPLPPLDGIVLANALHFVRDQASAMALAVSYLRPGGRLVAIEYEGRPPSRWVPYPVPSARFAELAAGAGLGPARVVATRPSAFGGSMYVSVAVGSGAGE